LISIVVSTVAYVIAAYCIKRYLERLDIPKGFTRSIVILVLALAVAYGVAALVDTVVS
jgi:hypothetical protein